VSCVEGIPELEPLEDDEEVHVAEEEAEEEDLGDELEDDFHGALEIESVVAL
jgi:hypothetical protein